LADAHAPPGAFVVVVILFVVVIAAPAFFLQIFVIVISAGVSARTFVGGRGKIGLLRRRDDDFGLGPACKKGVLALGALHLFAEQLVGDLQLLAAFRACNQVRHFLVSVITHATRSRQCNRNPGRRAPAVPWR